MKKLLFIFALLIQTTFVFATDNKQVAVARYENVKMYQQPGTSTQVIKSLKSTDELVVVRKYNSHWTIVMVNDVAGYVLTTELASPKVNAASTMAKK